LDYLLVSAKNSPVLLSGIEINNYSKETSIQLLNNIFKDLPHGKI